MSLVPATATMSKADPPLNSTTKELTSLVHMLHLTHHRNKNQHRLAKWYKSLSTLRRQLQKLLSEVRDLETSRTFSSSSAKESKYVRVARERVETRVRFWEERLMERWFIAFTNLTADNQYATLGLMLLACLAKVRMVVRPFGNHLATTEELVEVQATDETDLGEVVRRDDDLSLGRDEQVEDEMSRGVDTSTLASTKPKKKRKSTSVGDDSIQRHTEQLYTSPLPPRKKKKKRTNGDAFDDLFSSLL